MPLPQPDPSNSDRARGLNEPLPQPRVVTITTTTTAPNATATVSVMGEIGRGIRETLSGVIDGLSARGRLRPPVPSRMTAAEADAWVDGLIESAFRAEEQSRPEPGSVGGSLLGIDPWEYEEALRAQKIVTRRGSESWLLRRARLREGADQASYAPPVAGRRGAIEEWIENDPHHPYAITMRGLQGMLPRSADERRVRARPYEYRYADGYLARLARAYAWGQITHRTKIIRVTADELTPYRSPARLKTLPWCPLWPPSTDSIRRGHWGGPVTVFAAASQFVEAVIPHLGAGAVYIDATKLTLPVVRCAQRSIVLSACGMRECPPHLARAAINRHLARIGYPGRVVMGEPGTEKHAISAVQMAPETHRPLPLCRR